MQKVAAVDVVVQVVRHGVISSVVVFVGIVRVIVADRGRQEVVIVEVVVQPVGIQLVGVEVAVMLRKAAGSDGIGVIDGGC